MSDKDSSSNTKTILAIICAFLISISIFILISMNLLPTIYIFVIIPFLSYGVSILFSVLHQYTSCKKIQLNEITKSNSIVFLSNLAVSGILFLESLPIWKYVFGEYPPTNPITGIAYEPTSPEYVKAIETEEHYKLQPFTNTVKGVLPIALEENTKNGIAVLYWVFWATLIPHYFTLSVQGLCN